MKMDRGIAFPDADRFMAKQVSIAGTYQIENLTAALRYVTDFSLAIDGGAHVGLWSRVMAKSFARVIAVEPSPDTFEALQFNLTEAGCHNVEPRNHALGSEPGLVAMRLNDEQTARANTGARFVVPGGVIPVETIDSWALPSLGFLKLDVEGSEPMALRGAKATITRYRPIILYEDKDLWTRNFGMPKTAVCGFLESLGYRQLERVSKDAIWGPV